MQTFSSLEEIVLFRNSMPARNPRFEWLPELKPVSDLTSSSLLSMIEGICGSHVQSK
jgi:hypothetical protein